MPDRANAMRWDGAPGHYEVYYLTLTDPRTGVGIWIRYTMLAPVYGSPESALWFAAMDPRGRKRAARKVVFAIEQLRASADPFELRIGDAALTDHGMTGAFEDVSWELEWTPGERSYAHVHPLLERLKVAKTVLVLPQPDVSIDGVIRFGDERLDLASVRGAQAHLWGSKHANSWAWAHCNDFTTLDGEPCPGWFLDGVSVVVPRFGRELPPSTPVVARIDGRDFLSISPGRVLGNWSVYGLTGWRFEAVAGSVKLACEVDAGRDALVGVTYRDPDGELAYCYNTETASMRMHVYERARQVGGWAHRHTLTAPGRAHFEYAQRTPVADVALLV
jgi:hypothetical protein